MLFYLPFVFVLIASAFNIASAELPPWVYEEMKNNTPEVAVVDILTLVPRNTTGSDQCVFYADVTARVLVVERSASGELSKNDIVGFETYKRTWDGPNCEGWVGPSAPGFFNTSACGRLYLKFQDNDPTATIGDGNVRATELSAGGASFEWLECPEEDVLEVCTDVTMNIGGKMQLKCCMHCQAA